MGKMSSPFFKKSGKIKKKRIYRVSQRGSPVRIYPAVDIPLWVDSFDTPPDGSSVYNEIVGDLRLLQRKKASRL